MEKLVIYRDTEAIEAELERCPEVCRILGSVLNYLQEKGYSPDLDELEKTLQGYFHDMKHAGIERISEQQISSYLKKVILDSKHPNQELMGLKLNREKFQELLEIDPNDVAEIMSLMSGLNLEDWHYFRYTDFNSSENKVLLNPNYKKRIEDSHTRYAEGKRQIEVAKLLLKLIDCLSDYEKVTGYPISREEPVPGIRWNDGRSRIDMNFIRKYA
jgi:hypothetical protein